MNSNTTKGTICAVSSAVVFGLTPILASITFDMGSNALTITFYRNAMAVPVLLAMLLVRKIDLKISLRDFCELSIISILFSATTTYILYAAYDYIGVGLSTTLHFLYPMFTVIFGWIFFKDKLNKIKILSLILATVGVVLATGSGNSFALKGIVLAVGSAITYASYMIGIEKSSIHKMDSMKSMFYMCIANTFAIGLFDIPGNNIVYGLSPTAMILTFIVAIANSAFAYILLIVGIKLIGAGNAAIFSMLEPVSGVAGGSIFLGESLHIKKLISCIVILIAVMIPIVLERNKEAE